MSRLVSASTSKGSAKMPRGPPIMPLIRTSVEPAGNTASRPSMPPVDHVLPPVGYRQWVLSFSGPLAAV
ncbi:MAG TPA: hypothetical protein ENK31_03890 [Nannocystis exedens]|nr:hypothetical protein [Nannocystis exedens]